MMFQRRIPLTFKQRIIGALWPRCGYVRCIKYHTKRLLRLAGSPHAVAAGAAAGVFAACTPFLGFQLAVGLVVALMLGGSVFSMAITSWIGNPVTYPLIWATGYHVGTEIIDELPPDVSAPLHAAMENPVSPAIGPTVLGTTVIGVMAGIVTYALVMFFLVSWRKKRQQRVIMKRESLA